MSSPHLNNGLPFWAIIKKETENINENTGNHIVKLHFLIQRISPYLDGAEVQLKIWELDNYYLPKSDYNVAWANGDVTNHKFHDTKVVENRNKLNDLLAVIKGRLRINRDNNKAKYFLDATSEPTEPKTYRPDNRLLGPTFDLELENDDQSGGNAFKLILNEYDTEGQHYELGWELKILNANNTFSISSRTPTFVNTWEMGMEYKNAVLLELQQFYDKIDIPEYHWREVARKIGEAFANAYHNFSGAVDSDRQTAELIQHVLMWGLLTGFASGCLSFISSSLVKRWTKSSNKSIMIANKNIESVVEFAEDTIQVVAGKIYESLEAGHNTERTNKRFNFDVRVKDEFKNSIENSIELQFKVFKKSILYYKQKHLDEYNYSYTSSNVEEARQLVNSILSAKAFKSQKENKGNIFLLPVLDSKYYFPGNSNSKPNTYNMQDEYEKMFWAKYFANAQKSIFTCAKQTYDFDDLGSSTIRALERLGINVPVPSLGDDKCDLFEKWGKLVEWGKEYNPELDKKFANIPTILAKDVKKG